MRIWRFTHEETTFFHSPWCPPCRFYEKEFILPLIQTAGADKVQKVNAQENPFAADKYSIDKLPAIVLLAEVSTLIQWKSPKPLKYKGFGLLCV